MVCQIPPSRKSLLALALIAAVLTALVLGTALAAPASGYELDRWTIDAGSVSASNGSYRIVGVLAQPNPGKVVGGGYQLQGGFWQAPVYRINLPLVVR